MATTVPAPGIWFGVGAATAIPADAASASAAATGFTTNFVFTAEVMMVFLPLLVDQNLRLILSTGRPTRSTACYCGLDAIANAGEARFAGHESLSVNAHKRDLAMAHQHLQEFANNYAVVRLCCGFLTT
jgi:hypothetical protein